MDIGPVNSIRPVSPVRPSPPGFGNDTQNPDLAGIFATVFRNQEHDDSWSASRNPDRGLEDEDDDQDVQIDDCEILAEPRFHASPHSISFFV